MKEYYSYRDPYQEIIYYTTQKGNRWYIHSLIKKVRFEENGAFKYSDMQLDREICTIEFNDKNEKYICRILCDAVREDLERLKSMMF